MNWRTNLKFSRVPGKAAEDSRTPRPGGTSAHHDSRQRLGVRLSNNSTVQPSVHAFTLIELLVVISIIAILAAIAMPVTHQLRPDPVAAASRQLMDDFALARRRAIADH